MNDLLINRAIKRIKSNSKNNVEDGFNLLYSEYSSFVYYISYCITHNDDDSKDVLNEVFNKLFEHRNEISNQKKLKNWLIMVTKNLSINIVKKQRETYLLDEILYEEEQDRFMETISPYISYLTNLEVNVIIKHLYLDDTFKNIAKELNKTTDSISSIYRRGIQKIKNIIGVRLCLKKDLKKNLMQISI